MSSATHVQRGRTQPNLLVWLIVWLIVWLLACVFVFLLGTSHYLDDFDRLFGPDDVTTAQRIADDLADARRAAERPRTLAEAVLLACGPGATGKPVAGTSDIQCRDRDGRPSFYAVGAQP